MSLSPISLTRPLLRFSSAVQFVSYRYDKEFYLHENLLRHIKSTSSPHVERTGLAVRILNVPLALSSPKTEGLVKSTEPEYFGSLLFWGANKQAEREITVLLASFPGMKSLSDGRFYYDANGKPLKIEFTPERP